MGFSFFVGDMDTASQLMLKKLWVQEALMFIKVFLQLGSKPFHLKLYSFCKA